MKYLLTKLYISLVLVAVVNSGFMKEPPGKAIYEKNCSRCHGLDGTKGSFKAKDLQKSVATDSTINNLILNGKKIMPSYRKKLTEQEIKEVVIYTKSLRK